MKPEVELTSYEPVQIELPPAGATEAEVDNEVEALMRHYETYDNDESSSVLTEDKYADLKMKAPKEDGSEIAALTSDARFDREVLGMKKDETKTFSLDIPEDESAVLLSDLAGQTVNFEVTCSVVKTKHTPELTDEWVKDTFGFDTVDSLKGDIEKSITEQKDAVIPRIKENACAAKLVERVEDDVPDDMAEEAESELLQDFFQQLQRQGVSFDAYLASRGIDSDQFKKDIKMQAQDEAKQQLALDAWARKHGIEVTDADVSLEFERAGVEDPKKTEEEWRRAGRLYLLREGIMRRKAMEDVMDKAEVTEVDLTSQDK